MSKEIDKYRDKMLINRDDLESCLIEHAQLFWDVSEKGLHASSTRDELKLQIDQLHAELDEVGRKSLAKKAEKDGSRVTEAAVLSYIKSNNSFQKLQQEYLESKTIADEWSALKEAFYQRGYMLRELVQLEIRRMALDMEVATTERNADQLRKHKNDTATKRLKESYDSRTSKNRR